MKPKKPIKKFIKTLDKTFERLKRKFIQRKSHKEIGASNTELHVTC